MKKFFITIGALSLISVSFAQTAINTTSVPQKTVLVTKTEKDKVQEFHNQVKTKIEKHRLEMKSKKESLEQEKENLKNEIQQNKVNGKLTEEQKATFKSKLENIENRSTELRKENILFLEKIDKEREEFFKSLKAK